MLQQAIKHFTVVVILFVFLFLGYVFGNLLLRKLISIRYEDLYMYYSHTVETCTFALFVSILGYLVYLGIKKIKLNFLTRVSDSIIAGICFLLAIFGATLAGGSGIDLSKPFVIKNLFVIAICGFVTPTLQRMVGLKPRH